MRMVTQEDGNQTVVSNPEYVIYNGITSRGFIPLVEMDEGELHIAEELYKRNVLKKIRKDGAIGFKSYSKSPADSGSKMNPE
jgi:hypothetical protein